MQFQFGAGVKRPAHRFHVRLAGDAEAAETKRFPASEMRADVAYQIVHDELLLDGNARQNLATFCQTWDDENVHKLMDVSINKNWIDKEEYPQSAAISLKCVNMVADLWNAPAFAGNATGTNTIGSSEACMLGGHGDEVALASEQKALGKPVDKPNFRLWPVQVCWHKFARLLGCRDPRDPMSRAGCFMGFPMRICWRRWTRTRSASFRTFGVTYTGNFRISGAATRTRSTNCRRARASISTSTSTRRAAASRAVLRS